MSRRFQGETANVADAPPHRRWLSFVICVFLVLAVWAVFGQTLHHEFVNYDDDLFVYENPAITRGFNLQGILWAFTHVNLTEWWPVTALSHMLDCQLYGLNPGGHHLSNVLLHAATAIFLFLVLRSMTGALWRSAFVASVFAVHPLQVESVAWVTGRKDILSGLFFMLTLWAYVRYVQQSEAASRRQGTAGEKPSSFLLSPFYWLALAFFALGLMSKTMLVTLPFVLLLLDYWPLKRFTIHYPPFTIRRLVMEKIPLLLLTAGTCWTTIWAQRNGGIKSAQEFDVSSRLSNALVSYATYIGQLFYPAGLAPFYPHPGKSLPVWEIGVSLVVLLIISSGVLIWRRKHPYLLVGWLWYLGMLVPFIGLLQAGAQARADRYTYLPEIGLSIGLTWALAGWAATSWLRRVVVGISAVAVQCVFSLAASRQTSLWRDSETLWAHTVGCTSGNSVALNNLGSALLQKGRIEQAFTRFSEALRIDPACAQFHNNLGNAIFHQGRMEEATAHYREALRIRPAYAEAHNNLGLALLQQGRTQEAMAEYHEALKSNPAYADAHYNFGNAILQQGRTEEAIIQYREALQIKPAFVEAHNNLGSALFQQGRREEAIIQYREALRINPAYTDARNNLETLLREQGRAGEAIEPMQ